MGNRRFDYLQDFWRRAPTIWLRCKACSHTGEIRPQDLIDKGWPMNTPTKAMLARFRCSACGEKEFDWFPRSRD